jgi:hypothetical protein
MQEPPVSAIQAIQALLAPAVGISAVGLLLLALNNRYSIIINRIRLLSEEKRKYVRLMASGKDLEYTDKTRFMSINSQANELLMRSSLVRNAILSMQLAIAFFVLTSVGIGINLLVDSNVMKSIPLFIFIVGMVGVFVGVVFAAREVARSYKAVLLEVRAEE